MHSPAGTRAPFDDPITAVVARRHAFPGWTATGPNEQA
jgi:hypothetical protein